MFLTYLWIPLHQDSRIQNLKWIKPATKKKILYDFTVKHMVKIIKTESITVFADTVSGWRKQHHFNPSEESRVVCAQGEEEREQPGPRGCEGCRPVSQRDACV